MSSSLYLHVTPGDEIPIYRQIVRQVTEAVATGALEPGARLPSLRELSKKLVVAPLTVKKAYDQLEVQGLIETRRGQGTFVRLDATRSSQASAERLRPLARRLLLEADLGGIGPKELLELLEKERSALQKEREEGQQSA